ncbi:hypothetical protein M0R04_08410 [Candidatus Dojkabacteria bacterium]|jgi:hypothetical protein|nr:hypothetical protein [Candidatus Dojkabacteria bacterium]
MVSNIVSLIGVLFLLVACFSLNVIYTFNGQQGHLSIALACVGFAIFTIGQFIRILSITKE